MRSNVIIGTAITKKTIDRIIPVKLYDNKNGAEETRPAVIFCGGAVITPAPSIRAAKNPMSAMMRIEKIKKAKTSLFRDRIVIR
jgi:hypothetical protein